VRNRQQQLERSPGIAAVTFPRHDSVADIPGYMGQQCLAPRGKSEIDGAAEAAVPVPENPTRKSRHFCVVTEGHFATLLPHKVAQECFRIVPDCRQLLAAHVARGVWRDLVARIGWLLGESLHRE
jgi:hypothetical protein